MLQFKENTNKIPPVKNEKNKYYYEINKRSKQIEIYNSLEDKLQAVIVKNKYSYFFVSAHVFEGKKFYMHGLSFTIDNYFFGKNVCFSEKEIFIKSTFNSFFSKTKIN